MLGESAVGGGGGAAAAVFRVTVSEEKKLSGYGGKLSRGLICQLISRSIHHVRRRRGLR